MAEWAVPPREPLVPEFVEQEVAALYAQAGKGAVTAAAVLAALAPTRSRVPGEPFCSCGHGEDDICLNGLVYGSCGNETCGGACVDVANCAGGPDCCETRREASL